MLEYITILNIYLYDKVHEMNQNKTLKSFMHAQMRSYLDLPFQMS